MGRGGRWVLDVDVRKYFDSIPFTPLRECLARRVTDGVVRRMIDKWLKDYEQFIRNHLTLADDDLVPVIRINVMLLARHFLVVKRLKIVYVCCPNGLSYSSDELRLCWKKGHGITGAAWDTGHDVIYDSKDPNLNTAAGTLAIKQMRITSGLNSIYAIPISNGHSVLGTLNLDSSFHIDRTLFNHAYVKRLASDCATALVPFCFEDGVEA